MEKNEDAKNLDLTDLIDLTDLDLANVALDDAVVRKIESDLMGRAREVLGSEIEHIPLSLLRYILRELAQLRAEILYSRRANTDVDFSRTRQIMLNPLRLASIPSEDISYPERNDFDLDIRSKFIGTNWHETEFEGGKHWRWSGPGNVSTIVLPTLGADRLRITLHLGMAMPGIDIATDLVCTADSELVSLAKVEGKEGFWIGDIVLKPEHPLGKFVLNLSLPRTIKPPSDARALGISLTSCRIERLNK